jgi:hypothetical protein
VKIRFFSDNDEGERLFTAQVVMNKRHAAIGFGTTRIAAIRALIRDIKSQLK